MAHLYAHFVTVAGALALLRFWTNRLALSLFQDPKDKASCMECTNKKLVWNMTGGYRHGLPGQNQDQKQKALADDLEVSEVGQDMNWGWMVSHRPV